MVRRHCYEKGKSPPDQNVCVSQTFCIQTIIWSLDRVLIFLHAIITGLAKRVCKGKNIQMWELHHSTARSNHGSQPVRTGPNRVQSWHREQLKYRTMSHWLWSPRLFIKNIHSLHSLTNVISLQKRTDAYRKNSHNMNGRSRKRDII